MIEDPYSTWLIPHSPLIDEIQRDIRALSNECSTPNFQAHITLVPDTIMNSNELIERIKVVAKKHRPLKINFTAIGYSLKEYWQSLYLHVQPTQELINVRNDLRTAYGLEITSYMPHMSLLYGTDIPNQKKEDLIKKHNLLRYVDKSWEIDQISLYLTHQKDVGTNGWKKITEIPLH
jgi:2'-5' RNA ligase